MHWGENLLAIVVVLLILMVILFNIQDRIKTWLRIKREKQQSIPLHVSREEFFKRFQEQIAGNRYYFCGEIEENHRFWFYYYPYDMKFAWVVVRAPSRYDWYQIHGTVLEKEVIYKYAGYGTFRDEQFERERLLNKLKELVS